MADARAQEIIDEDDWVELDRAPMAASAAAFFDASVKITVAAVGNPKAGKGKPLTPKARASILLRGAAADFVRSNGPRFRIAIGGAKANHIRITPDIHQGKFEARDPPGASDKSTSQRFSLGVVAAWPEEDRPATEAEWRIVNGSLMLTLPEAFAVATPKPLAPPAPAPKPAPAPAPQPERKAPTAAFAAPAPPPHRGEPAAPPAPARKLGFDDPGHAATTIPPAPRAPIKSFEGLAHLADALPAAEPPKKAPPQAEPSPMIGKPASAGHSRAAANAALRSTSTVELSKLPAGRRTA